MSKLKSLQQLTSRSDEPSAQELEKASRINEDLFGSLGFIDTETLVSEPPVEQPWAVNGMLPLAGTSLWAGREKVGKTTLIRQLCLAVATGRNFLGRTTRRGLVMYYALEENKEFLKEDLKKLNTEGSGNLLWRFGLLKEKNGSGYEQLERIAKTVRPTLIVLDTMVKFLTVNDLNSYGDVVKTMSYVTDIARKYHCHIMYVHHMNKGMGYNDRDKILGSVGTQAEVDTIVTITKDDSSDENRYIQTTQRYGESMCKTRLDYNVETKESFIYDGFDGLAKTDDEDDLL